jgi:predicted amidophosphoribosyltransferase
LILRAKVQSDHQALGLLEEIFRRHPAVTRHAAWCDVVMPAPSSLWGRMRGRFDLAYFLARSIAQDSGKPLVSAPGHLHWRLFKRAQQRRRQTSGAEPQNQAAKELPVPRGSKILIVDDIVTTGVTLRETAAALPRHLRSKTRFLTLARTPRS